MLFYIVDFKRIQYHGLVNTKVVQKIKLRVKQLPCLCLANPNFYKIVETDASNRGLLKQKNPSTSQEELLRFTSGMWERAQINYFTIKKEILSLVKCINKFQDDILNQKFLIRVDCSTAEHILQKDIKNIVSK